MREKRPHPSSFHITGEDDEESEITGVGGTSQSTWLQQHHNHRQHHGENQGHRRGKPGTVAATTPMPSEETIPLNNKTSPIQNQKENHHNSKPPVNEELSTVGHSWNSESTRIQEVVSTTAKNKVMNLNLCLNTPQNADLVLTFLFLFFCLHKDILQR